MAESKPGEREGASMSTGYDPRKVPSSSLSRGRTMATTGFSRGHIADSCGARKGPASWQALQSGGCISRHEETVAFMARYQARVVLERKGMVGRGVEGIAEEVRELFFGTCYFLIKCFFRVFYPLILLLRRLYCRMLCVSTVDSTCCLRVLEFSINQMRVQPNEAKLKNPLSMSIMYDN